MLQIPEPKWTADGGLNYSAERLVVDHQPLARARARKYFANMRRSGGCGGSVDDLESEAMLGLMDAIKRFDPSKGFAFGTYAVWWIDAALREFTTRNRSIVRHPRPALNYAGTGAPDQPKPSIAARRFTGAYKPIGADTSLDAFEGDTLDRIIGTTENPETTAADRQQSNQRRALLASAIDTLTARERAIIAARHGDDEPATLGDLATRFGISAERVRQIEVVGVSKIKLYVRSIAAKAAHLNSPRRVAAEVEGIAAMRPSVDPIDNVLRHCVSGSFGMDQSPEPAAFIERMRSAGGME
ncbi:sigma-70 family RNA polymerase sigma factor [Acidiphilium rubrum]|uniref:sigma-70 family RNA polymerase sigma factor n=1 Tax=Acidiphilium rubrum TaxID=526 RepID=UPI002BBDCC46|nr:sigma-70 family RNA polymerase sigma factor [Acidiphilium rubrum]HQT86367.1 sigma-70 family RNA polymerase sigma factor [Acidiphilium rubrum]